MLVLMPGVGWSSNSTVGLRSVACVALRRPLALRHPGAERWVADQAGLAKHTQIESKQERSRFGVLLLTRSCRGGGGEATSKARRAGLSLSTDP